MTTVEVTRFGYRVLVEYSPAEPVIVRVDPGRLKLVCRNINHFAARDTSQADEIRICVTVDDIKLRVKVINRGIGIDATTLLLVFDLFAQASTQNLSFLGRAVPMSNRCKKS
jgi:signal transduction histidine kinase